MKARLPFPVCCSHVAPGKRSYSLGYVIFDDVFDVPVVSSADTVVAATVSYAGVEDEIYRFHEGHFYRPASTAWCNSDEMNNRDFPNDLSSSELAALLVNGGDELRPGEFIYSYMRLVTALPGIKSHAVLRFENSEDEIERRRSLARHAYQDMSLVIDGVVWMRIDEPHLIVWREPRNHDDNATVQIKISERRPVPGRLNGIVRNLPYQPPQLSPTFRLDRVDEMLDFVSDYRHKTGLETRFQVPELRVLRSELFAYDDETDNLVRSADEVLGLTQCELRGASKAFVDAWHDVDVAVAKGLVSLETCSGEEIEDRLQIIQAASSNPEVRKTVSRALERYSLRTISPAYR